MSSEDSCLSVKVNQYNAWKSVIENRIEPEAIATQFLTDQIQIDYFSECEDELSKPETTIAMHRVIEALNSLSVDQIRSLLKNCGYLKEVSAASIPQYSSFALAAMCVPDVLISSDTALSFRELGYKIYPGSKSDTAADKFGENHGKFATLIGLARVTKKNNHKAFAPSSLTDLFCKIEQTEKMDLLQRLCFRIPIIQHAVITSNPQKVIDKYLQQLLSTTTANRRRTNVMEVLAFALGE